MKKRLSILPLLVILFLTACSNHDIPEGEALISLRYEEDYSPSYYEAIEMYNRLDEAYPFTKLIEYGKTDSGKPLHLFVISKSRDFDPVSIRNKDLRIVMVNNGIHPGEPCGIDASIEFADDVCRNKDGMAKILDEAVICIIPVYNIGGALYRSPYHRTNQPGPSPTGYRGNAKNLDLNRDFVKCDTRNARSFAQLFRIWKPDVFLDTHTTNGSDHQYHITLIAAQHDAMQEDLGKYFHENMVPELYKMMKKTPYELIPYVSYMTRDLRDGFGNYVQTPRYSTGYAAQFNTMCFMTENHTYKPYADRVKSVYHFIHSMCQYTAEHSEEIGEVRKLADEKIKTQKTFALDYKMDTSKYRMMEFKGYERGEKISPLTGLKTYGYDYNNPFTANIKYFNDFTPTLTVEKPEYYIVPFAWSEVIERLKINQVEMKQLSKDTILEVEVYYIDNLRPVNRASNGHRFHNQFDVRTEVQKIKFYKGDYVIETNQEGNKYIVEQLEPLGADSFFRWNFFDNILENREWFGSGENFEKKMLKYLESHPDLKASWEQKRSEEPDFAKNHRAQLYYLFQNSEWPNKWLNRYPVARINEACELIMK